MGGKDHLMPPSVNRSNAKKYRNSEAITETYEFPDRPHFTCGVPGWEQVADYALDWATSHARTRRARPTDSGLAGLDAETFLHGRMVCHGSTGKPSAPPALGP
jgi:hypothetical protein